ncbi:MAG: DoxX family membrane protein [Marinifilaceae bacterium]|jgi:uncharacterized membrane protein YphA (DoxX/SURF4 family)
MKNKKIILIARIVLGLVLVVFGLNKFIGFMPMPPMPEAASSLMEAFGAAGYIFPMLAIVEIIVGLMLLINRFVAMALLFLSPLSVNIILFHLALDPAGIGAGVLVFLLNLYLLLANKDKYDPVLKSQ